MIFISGMMDGSGDGTAAGRKAGWLSGPRIVAAPAPRPVYVPVSRAAPARQVARPALGPDGRPLPPDGSVPPSRPVNAGDLVSAGGPAPMPRTGASEATPSRPAYGPDGRPVPPAGPAYPRPREPAAAQPAPPPVAPPPVAREPGSPLPPGAVPAAPSGHTFTSRPAVAPPGEFLFDVRCSCGAERRVPIKAADLRRAAEHGRSPADAIAAAVQDALDAMHRAGA